VLISVNNSVWVPVNQIIDQFDNNVATLPGVLRYKRAFLTFLSRAVHSQNPMLGIPVVNHIVVLTLTAESYEQSDELTQVVHTIHLHSLSQFGET